MSNMVHDGCTRTRPWGWRADFIAKSPFRNLEAAREALRKYYASEALGFTQVSSLKSMGKIPRSKTGLYTLGHKYAALLHGPEA